MASNDNVYMDSDNRLFYLSDEIDNEVVGKLCFQLLVLNEQDNKKEEKEIGFERKPIKLYIQSFGGSVYDCFALIDTIKNSKTPVRTYCNGCAMSAAFLVFLAGKKRFATSHTTFLYHQVSQWIEYQKFQSLVENIEELKRMQEECENLFIAVQK